MQGLYFKLLGLLFTHGFYASLRSYEILFTFGELEGCLHNQRRFGRLPPSMASAALPTSCGSALAVLLTA